MLRHEHAVSCSVEVKAADLKRASLAIQQVLCGLVSLVILGHPSPEAVLLLPLALQHVPHA